MSDMPFDGIGEVDVDTPNIARMYDYFLGGAANFAIDREAGETFMSGYPGITTWAQINRSFLGRAVRDLCRAGIDQFLDLGSGVPTVGNVHEIARRENPAARVAYVDIEDVAIHHARRLLEPHDQHVTVNQIDLRDPHAVLTAPGVVGLLDFARPVAVLAVAILDIIAVDDPTALMATYRDACAPGSALVVSHSAQLAMSPDERAHVDTIISGTNTPDQHWRTRDEVAALLPGYTLLNPGVVPSAAWRPDEAITDEHAARSNAYAAVGVK